MNKPKEILNQIQSSVHKELLKPKRYKKNGRTFNRESEDGLIEVINFQSGQYQFDNIQEISGLRENLYGSFTINLGICIPEYFHHRFNKSKKFYQEYDCSIRARIGSIIGTGEDLWWKLSPNVLDKQIERIIEVLNLEGLKWLEGLNSRDKVYRNWEMVSNKYGLSNTAKLNVGTVKLLNGDKTGEEIFREYYQTIERENHKEWVKEEAKRLNVKLKSAPNNA